MAQPKKKGPAPRKPAPGRPAVAAAPRPMDGMTLSQKVAWISLQVLVFAVPLAMTNANWLAKLGLQAFSLPLTYDQFDIAKVFIMRACVLVGVGAWSFEFFLRGGTLRRTKADWLVLGFLGWVLVTSFTSVSLATAMFGKYRRYEGFLSFLTYAAVFFLVVQLADRPGRIRSIAHTLVVSGTIVSGYGVVQFFGLDPIRWGSKLPFEFNRAFSTYGNPDLLGGFIVIVLPIALVLALTEKRQVWRGVYWAAFIVTAFCWGAAFVRGAWIGGVVAITAVIVAAVLAKAPWGIVDWSAAGLTAAFGVTFVAWSMRATNEVLNIWARVQSIFKFNEGSALTRFEIWQAALQATKERPIFGWGADTFRLVFPHTKPLAYTKDAGYLSVADNVHDYPLQIAAGIGIVGFILLYAVFGWVLYLGAPNAFSRGKGYDRLIVTGFWAAALGYVVHLFFGLSVTGSTVLLWLALGIVLAPTARAVKLPAFAWGPAAGIAVAALCTAGFIANGVYIVADNYYLKSQFPTSDAPDAVASIRTAIALNPYNDMYRAQLGQSYNQLMLSWVNQAKTDQQGGKDPSTSLQNAQRNFQLAEESYRSTIAFVPLEYDNYVFLAALYNQAGSYFNPKYFADAITVADEGMAQEPFGPAIQFQKAIALYNSGKEKETVALLEKTVKMDPAYTDPMLLLGDAYKALGETEKARAIWQQVLTILPGDTRATEGLASLGATASTTTTP